MSLIATLNNAGIQYAPGDTGTIGVGSIPNVAVYVIDTNTQSNVILGAAGPNEIRISGNVTATYPNTTAVRIYGSHGTYGSPSNDGCYTVNGVPSFGLGETTITLAGGSLEPIMDDYGTLTKGIVSTFHIGSPGNSPQLGTNLATTPALIQPAIIAVNTGTKTFSVLGDFAALFASPFTRLKVDLSTGNDGIKVLASSARSGVNTNITITDVVSSAVADGTIEVLSSILGGTAGCGHNLTFNLSQVVSAMQGDSDDLGIIYQRLQGGKQAYDSVSFQNLSNASPAPSSNTAVVKTLVPITTGSRVVVQRLAWSYNGTPTGGKLTITGGTANLEVDIASSGANGFILGPYMGTIGTNVVVTLAAGGVGVTGRLCVDVTNRALN